MTCSVIRNENTNAIERVLAPNGKDSVLFNTVLANLYEANVKPDPHYRDIKFAIQVQAYYKRIQNVGSLNQLAIYIKEKGKDRFITDQEVQDYKDYVNAQTAEYREEALRLWAQVYTPSFKAWFGDWEKNIASYPFNEKVNFDLNLIRSNSGKIGEQGATAEGVRDLVMHILQNEDFLELADTTSIKSMAEYLQKYQGERNKVLDFVRKNPIDITQLPDGSYNLNDGNHRATVLYYSGVERVPAIIKDSTNKKASTDSSNDFGGFGGVSPDNGNNSSSKIVDENGEPMLTYHWTKEQFDEFMLEKKGSNTGHVPGTTDLHLGFFLSQHENYAELINATGFGSNRMPLFVNMRNPLYDIIHGADGITGRLTRLEEFGNETPGKYDGYLADINAYNNKESIPENYKEKIAELGLERSVLNVNTKDNKAERMQLIQMEQDAVKVNDNTSFTYIVIPDPNQVKSLFNNGVFSESSNNIFHQLDSALNDFKETSKPLYQMAKDIPSSTFAKTRERYSKILNRLSNKFGIAWEEDNEMQAIGRFENGKVFINMRRIQPDTPFHEFAHPFIELVKVKNPALYKSLASRAKRLTSDGQSIADYVTSLYTDLSREDLDSEIIVTALGLSSQKRIDEFTDKEANDSSSFRQIVLTLFDKIKSYLHELFENRSLKINAAEIHPDISFRALSDILFVSDNQIDFEGMTFKKLFEQKSADVFAVFQDFRNRINLVEPGHTYYFDGKAVKDSVHSKIIEPYMRSIYGEKEFNEKQKQFNEMLRDRGTEIHNDIEAIGARYVDPSTGLLRDNPLAKGAVETNDGIYETLENFMKNLFGTYEKGTRFIFEQPMYDKYLDMSGTMDFLAIRPDGTIDIKDWKSLKTSIGENDFISDISHIKQTAWKMQISEYRRMIESFTGAKVNTAMAIPIESNPDSYYDEESEDWVRTKSNVIQIGNVDPTKIPKALAYLAPVVTQDFKTGDPDLDNLIEAFYKIHENTRRNQRPPEGESREAWLRKLNTLAETIRDLQVRKDINTILQRGNDIIYQTNRILDRPATGFAEITAKLKQINDLKDEAEFVMNIPRFFFKMVKNKELDPKQKEQLESISLNSQYILKELNDAEIGLGEQLANEKGVNNIDRAEIKIGGSSALFKHISRFTNATILTFRKYYDQYRNSRDRKTREDLNTFQGKLKALQTWAAEKGMSMESAYDKLLAKGKDGKANPERLLYKYSSSFWKSRSEAKSKNDYLWFASNYTFDVKAYEAAYKERSKWEQDNAIATTEDKGRQQAQVKRNMERWESLNDVRKFERAWTNENNRYLSISAKNYSDDWNFLHTKGNEPLLEFYNELIRINTKAQKLGMIGSKHFAPSIRADKLEQIFNNKGEGALKLTQFLDDLKAREGEGFLERDPITGQEVKRIPVLFTHSLAKKLEDGTRDYSKYSRALDRNFAVWMAHVHDYEMKSQLEVIGNAMVNIEKGKQIIARDRYGNPVKKDGKVVLEQNTEANSKILADFVDFFVYGKAQYSNSDVKIGDYSLTRAGRKLQAWMSHRTLGLNVTSAASNLFGGTANAFVELTRSGLATKTDWMQAMADVTGGNAKAKAFITLIDPLSENQTSHRINRMTMNTVNKVFNMDNLYFMMQKSDQAVQLPVAIALLKNYTVRDGKLMKIKDVAKMDTQYNIDNLNMSEIKALDSKLAAKIDEMKDKESLWAKATVGEKLEHPDLTDDLVDEMRDIIRRTNRNILGSVSMEDTNRARLMTIGMFGMQFRNWMPQLVSERFKSGDMDYDMNAFTQGKVVTTFQHFWSKQVLSLTKEMMFGLGDLTLNKMKENYQKEKQKFIDRGGEESEFISFSDFKDTYIGNIRSTMQEITMMLSILALVTTVGSIPPDDDDLKGAHKMLVKTMNRMQSELSFYYNPTSFTDLVNKPFPVVGLVTDIQSFATNTIQEGWYQVTGDQEGQKKARPMKYAYKIFPITKEAQLWMAAFNDEYRKENNITFIH